MFKTVEHPLFQVHPGKLVELEGTVREDLWRLNLSSNISIVCSPEQLLLTKDGLVSVECLITDMKNMLRKKRTKICTFYQNKMFYPIIRHAFKIGYGKAYKIVSDSKHYMVANTVLFGS